MNLPQATNSSLVMVHYCICLQGDHNHFICVPDCNKWVPVRISAQCVPACKIWVPVISTDSQLNNVEAPFCNKPIKCGPMMPYVNKVNTGSDNGLLPDVTKPLTEPIGFSAHLGPGVNGARGRRRKLPNFLLKHV